MRALYYLADVYGGSNYNQCDYGGIDSTCSATGSGQPGSDGATPLTSDDQSTTGQPTTGQPTTSTGQPASPGEGQAVNTGGLSWEFALGLTIIPLILIFVIVSRVIKRGAGKIS